MEDPLDSGQEEHPRAFVFEDEHDLAAKRNRFWIIGVLIIAGLGLFVAEKYVTVVKPNIESMAEKSGSTTVERLESAVRTVVPGNPGDIRRGSYRQYRMVRTADRSR